MMDLTDAPFGESNVAVLARLAHVLTICARDTYEVRTRQVLEPEVLRAYNELLHRVTAAVALILAGEKSISLDEIRRMMEIFAEQNNRSNEMKWTLAQAIKEG